MIRRFTIFAGSRPRMAAPAEEAENADKLCNSFHRLAVISSLCSNLTYRLQKTLNSMPRTFLYAQNYHPFYYICTCTV
jgi:hypothetical protein